MRAAIVVAVAVAALGGCKKEKQIAGIEQWHVNRTTRADATGRCLPEKLSDGRDGAYCFGQKPIGIRGMRADIDLFFASMEPDAKLVEIQLKVGGCDEEKLTAWLQTNLGDPFERQGASRVAWKNAHLFAIGYLPLADEPGRCLVRIVPRREENRFAALWSPAPSSAPAGR